MTLDERLTMTDVINGGPPEETEGPVWQESVSHWWTRLTTSQTGPGPITDYIQHPFNVNRSSGLGQVLRGLTGLLGTLDLAVVDIIVGLARLVMPDLPGGGEEVAPGVEDTARNNTRPDPDR